MKDVTAELKKLLEGEVFSDQRHVSAYSTDASLYELLPEAVIFPKDTNDVKKLVRFVHQRKSSYPTLSITPRGAGTDMSGGPLSSSLVIDMTRYFNQIDTIKDGVLHARPGTFLKRIDPALAKAGYMLGSAPVSRALSTLGGMVANNSAGEQSLRFGNTERKVLELKAVLADGNEYTFKPLNRQQLKVKLAAKTYEGEIYRRVYRLVEDNYDLVRNAKPRSTKNSMGYNLWSVWDRDSGVFDMTKLLCGSQGTLGIITDIKLAVVPKPKHTGLLLMYLTSKKDLGKLINLVLRHDPATFEGFDDVTFSLGIKYFKSFRQQMGTKEWLKQQAVLATSAAKFKRRLPNIVLMAEFEGDSYAEVNDKLLALRQGIVKSKLKVKMEIEGTEDLSAPFWRIRRASLTLLRERIKNRYACAFMDDLAVLPRYVPAFLPEVRKIIRKYKLPATIAGHFGDGNFHIIPLMDISSPKEQQKFEPAMRELVPIVKRYGGTLAGEHNDGLVRGPWLRAMFGDKVFKLFVEVKESFDPMYVFNPHKKTDADWEYSMSHIRDDRQRNLYK